MKSEKREYLQVLCKFFLVILLAVLPLYLVGGYYKLGDSKYQLFRNSSLICLGIWIVLEGAFLAQDIYDKIRYGGKTKVKGGKIASERIGTVDIFVLAYGLCVLISALCSSYDTAWVGYDGWYMGAMSQLIFVGIYFFVSRYYSYSILPLYAGDGALLVVVVIGLLNRLGIDWLGVFQRFTEQYWEYSHMISTIGNINWFCGYCSVVLALPISGYLQSRRMYKRRILYGISVLGLTLLFIQGSDSGIALAMIAIGVCLMMGIRKPDFFRKGLLLFTGTMLGVWSMGWLIHWLGAENATPVDGMIYDRMQWLGWLVLAGVAMLLYLISGLLQSRLRESTMRKLITAFWLVLVLTAAALGALILLQWSQGNFEEWGSGRGTLWRLAWEGFLQADWGSKLVGVGPDCYAEYLSSIGKAPIITTEGYWANSIFANAHNEWLNQLVNIGILGVGCYAGILITALRRYRGMFLAILMLVMYGVHSLVSFQQVLNAPLLFAMLGICEATWRRKMAKDLTRQ